MKITPSGLAGASARHPWRTIGLWIVLLAVITVLSGVIGGNTNSQNLGFTNSPDSQKADDLIKDHFKADENASEVIVFHSDSLTVNDPAFKGVVTKTIANLDQSSWKDEIASVTNYYEAGAAGTDLISGDSHSLIVPISFTQKGDEYTDDGENYVKLAQGAATSDVNVYTVGDISGDYTFGKIAGEDTNKDTTIGLPVAGIVLIIVFGALIA
ncbi:MAG TPA: MMPL family transporter, partial [Thermomicrobiales bacterium]|nr:MMPL family transporter [Thermomicrobiales bacterium]